MLLELRNEGGTNGERLIEPNRIGQTEFKLIDRLRSLVDLIGKLLGLLGYFVECLIVVGFEQFLATRIGFLKLFSPRGDVLANRLGRRCIG